LTGTNSLASKFSADISWFFNRCLFFSNFAIYSLSLSFADTHPESQIVFALYLSAALASFFHKTSTTDSWNSYAISAISCLLNNGASSSRSNLGQVSSGIVIFAFFLFMI
jgi:hypothetical protein